MFERLWVRILAPYYKSPYQFPTLVAAMGLPMLMDYPPANSMKALQSAIGSIRIHSFLLWVFFYLFLPCLVIQKSLLGYLQLGN